MESKPYQRIKNHTQYEMDDIKGSRFIAHGFHIQKAEDLSKHITQVVKQYPDASHHCWAFQLSDAITIRFSDDGEPSGSAGKPILAPLVGREIYNTLIIVSRYFGGVKLGIGGLVRAYSKCTNELLDHAEIITVQPKVKLLIGYDYDETAAINTVLNEFNLTPQDSTYTEKVELLLSVNSHDVNELKKRIANATSGKASIIQKQN